MYHSFSSFRVLFRSGNGNKIAFAIRQQSTTSGTDDAVDIKTSDTDTKPVSVDDVGKSQHETLGGTDDAADIKTSDTDTRRVSVDDAGKSRDELRKEAALKGTITVEGQISEMAVVTGVPEQHIKERYVRIFRPAKNSMQSGSASIRRWRIEFDTRERWENPLIGWTSSGDPLSSLEVDFASKEEAVEFVKKNGWDFFVEEPAETRVKLRQTYASVFAWNKRTRRSTK